MKIANELGIPSTQCYCTGDVVGYCANPEETVQLIRTWGVHTIAGNVEIQLREGSDECGCNFDEGSRCDTFSRKWYPFAQAQLSQESIDWMNELPFTMEWSLGGKKCVMIHGGYPNTSQFIFESTPWSIKQEISEKLNADIIICGHSGLPFVQQLNGKSWINAGVIGMPANDGSQQTWYTIIDLENETIELKSLEYDAQLSSKKMVENKLPMEYARTLVTGIWDNCEILPEKETAEQGIILEEKTYSLQ
jgi:predicted phosphodiesterase